MGAGAQVFGVGGAAGEVGRDDDGECGRERSHSGVGVWGGAADDVGGAFAVAGRIVGWERMMGL